MSTPKRGRPTTPRRLGNERAAYLAHRLGVALRDQRQANGITQRELAQGIGCSQPAVSSLERGGGTTTTLETWASAAAVIGLQLAAFLERAPGADQPRDLQHLRRQSLVIATAAGGGWTALPEAALPGDGPRPMSVDVLLTRAIRREVAVVEVWDLLADGGASMRGLEAKVLAIAGRHGPEWNVQGLLLVRGTTRNRALIGELRPLFDARYPASSAQWLRALSDSATPLPAAGGLAWTDVAGTRLIAAHRPPSLVGR